MKVKFRGLKVECWKDSRIIICGDIFLTSATFSSLRNAVSFSAKVCLLQAEQMQTTLLRVLILLHATLIRNCSFNKELGCKKFARAFYSCVRVFEARANFAGLRSGAKVIFAQFGFGSRKKANRTWRALFCSQKCIKSQIVSIYCFFSSGFLSALQLRI